MKSGRYTNQVGSYPAGNGSAQILRKIAAKIPEDIPIILETLIGSGQSDVETEIQRTREDSH